MAVTLKWPCSLTKQVNAEQKTKKQKPPKYLKVFVVLAFTGIALIPIVKVYTNNIIHGLYLYLAWIFVAFMIIHGYRIFTSGESTGALKGLKGEEIVAHELDRLPEGWYIINDINIKGSQIDHIAIGPAGIFCLETKNWNNAGCDENGDWYHFHTGHWAPVNKNPAKQNEAHISSLKEFLKENLNTNENVKSVIVLAHPSGKYNIKTRIIPPDNTLICLPFELHRLLPENSGNNTLSPTQVRDIAHALKNLYSKEPS